MYPQAVKWVGELDGCAEIIDQTLLPGEHRVLRIESAEAMWEAIKMLRVRGAPAIGCAAALGLVLGVRDCVAADAAGLAAEVDRVAAYLGGSRPTAVNLFWALERMRAVAARGEEPGAAQLKERLLAEARAIVEEDRQLCRGIGRHGAALVPDGATVLTHCNAGALATAGMGTALAVIYAAKEAGKAVHVYADETRPLLQGARLTAWELHEVGVPVTVICDNMAGLVLSQGKIDMVVVGADRIARNGDAANKIGTYSLSILAREHGVPFYVAAPSTTFDLACPSGKDIPIEERDAGEIAMGFGRRTAPENVRFYNPAFDVTPAGNIRAFITERGVLEAPFETSIAASMGGGV